MLLGAIVAICVAGGLTTIAVRFGHTPEPPREHLYETEDGDRGNPFADLAAGAAANTARCRACGEVVETTSYRICRSCLDRSVPGD